MDAREKSSHQSNIAHYDSLTKGREGMLSRLDALSTAFSDPQIEILSLLAKGDMFADCFRVSANQTDSFFGISATGKRVSWLQNEIFTIRKGKISGDWVTRIGSLFFSNLECKEWVSISSMKKEMP